MTDQPSLLELVGAVKNFLEHHAMPELKGQTAFHARVAANALAIVERELTLGPKAMAEEKARLVALLGGDGTLDELNRRLCAHIREERVGLDTPGLAAHLEQTARDQLAINQPDYSGLNAA
ncbi:MAG: hypothetical protein KGJ75_02615 [Alphaproteobacteria bacterium]|nr:hypothetical protein [Alphaproteobacteria bacterium]MDE2011795.1 hypothetical protein [Alphaproteobacteria bacterium]